MPATLTVPRNADELSEMLGDPHRSKQILESKDSLQSFMQAYADGQAKVDPGLTQQIEEAAQRVYADMARNGGVQRVNLGTANDPRVVGNGQYNADAVGARLDARFPRWRDYIPAIAEVDMTQKGHEDRMFLGEIRNALGSTVPSDGGFLIPEVLRAELLRVALEQTVVRSRARVVPMDSLTVPYPTIDDTSHASSVYGGITAYWTEEGGALTDSSPSFGRVTLQAKKLTLYSEIPNELLSDSIISLQQFIDTTWPEALAFWEDDAFINGNGAGQPIGFLNADAAVTVSAEAGQAAGTILWENIVNMYARMIPSSIGRAVWVCNINAFPQLATMALAVGTGGSAVWIGNGGGNAVGAGSGAPPTTILGRPVIFTEKVPTLGSVGDINFVDLGYYLVGDRQMMQAATSDQFKFQNDKTAFRVIERVDGQPWIRSAITPRTGTSTLTPFVKLAAR